MIRAFAIAAFGLATLTGTASAETLFRGTFVVTAASGCNGDPSGGDIQPSQFHPLTSGNANFAALTLIGNFSANSYRVKDDKNFTKAFQEVETGGVGWSLYSGNEAPTSVLISKSTPALTSITDKTSTVTLEGKIKNIWGEKGAEKCTITFTAAYIKRL